MKKFMLLLMLSAVVVPSVYADMSNVSEENPVGELRRVSDFSGKALRCEASYLRSQEQSNSDSRPAARSSADSAKI